MVEVIVGRQRTTYILYKTLLCQKSSFFQAAFAGSFAEAARKSIALEEDNAEAFDIFVFWLYKDQLPISSDASMNTDTAFEFYVLADKLLLPPELKVQALDCIKGIYAQGAGKLSAQSVARVLKMTAPDCPLRRFFLDLACHQYFCVDKVRNGEFDQSNWLKECLKDCNSSEVVEVLDEFKDTLLDSGRLKSMRERHWTVFNAIEGPQSLADVPRYQTGFLKRATSGESNGEAIMVD